MRFLAGLGANRCALFRTCVLLCVMPWLCHAFAPSSLNRNSRESNWMTSINVAPKHDIMVDMPPSGSGLQAQLRIDPVLDNSEIIEVRYKLPFGLDVAPKDNLAVCTKDGPGGEKIGDILRYTSQWTIGLPQGDGLISTAAAFSGGVKWQCSLFDVLKAKAWEQVVEALVSNVESRTDEVVLIFERPLD